MIFQKLTTLASGLLIAAAAGLPGAAHAQDKAGGTRLSPQALQNATADCVNNKQPISCVVVSNQYRLAGPNGEHDEKRRRYMTIGCDAAAAGAADTEKKRVAGAGTCHRAARIFFEGIGGPVDYKTAFMYFGHSCDFGNMTSCAYNAESLQNGRGVAEDKTAALDLYRKACSETMPIACYQPARMLFFSSKKSSDTVGTDPDFVFGRKAAGVACDTKWTAQGISCWYYGLYLDNGWGGTKQPAAARRAYKMACDIKQADDVCTSYALSLTKAPPAERDLTTARQLLQKACAAEYEYACNILARLK